MEYKKSQDSSKTKNMTPHPKYLSKAKHFRRPLASIVLGHHLKSSGAQQNVMCVNLL